MSKGSGVVKAGLSGKAVAVIAVSTMAVCATAIVITVMFLNQKEEPAPVITSGVQVITEENYRSIEQDLQEKIEKGMFQTYMNTTWRFPNGSSPSTNAVMGNSSANNYGFYFTVTLERTNEVVLTSGLLPVGTEMGEVRLDEPLAMGTYPAVVNINMIDDEGQPVESNMGFNITLVIEN